MPPGSGAAAAGHEPRHEPRASSPDNYPLQRLRPDQLTQTWPAATPGAPDGLRQSRAGSRPACSPTSRTAHRSPRPPPATGFPARRMRCPRHRAARAEPLTGQARHRRKSRARASVAAATAKPEVPPATAYRPIMHMRSIPTGQPAFTTPPWERHNDPSGQARNQTPPTANPPISAAVRAFSSNFSITQCDAVYRRSLTAAHRLEAVRPARACRLAVRQA